MKTLPLITVLSTVALLAAAPSSRADLGHSWDSGSEPPASVNPAHPTPASSAEPATGDSIDTSAPASPSLDDQIADLLDDGTLAQPASDSFADRLSDYTVPVSDEELLLDRLAVEAAAEAAADAESPSTPDTSAPIGASDTTFASGTDRIASRVSSTMAVQGVAPSEAAPSGAFTASDKAANKPYASQGTWNIGDNGGSGFGEWRKIDSLDSPNRALESDFIIYANAGREAAIGRSFANDIALESGTFSVEATHAFSDFTEKFSGFAIYGAGDTEIFRWGTTRASDEDGNYLTGFWYSDDGGYEYHAIDSAAADVLRDSRVMYSITWNLLESSIDLKIDGAGIDKTYQLSTGTSSAVTAIAALVSGYDSSTESDKLHFDDLKVSGRAVPEPSTLVLLLLGVLALRPRHKS